ncbi:CBF/Mak21 family-domain-containing protein [Trichophaea hybrida]|nr:CBF/Mak21 family-domain-containing protein [Trichophaea hybrida]
MAKKDSNQSDVTRVAPSTADDVAPVFSSDALSKLTQRIQSDFEKAKSGPAAPKEGKKEKKDRKKKERKERDQAAKIDGSKAVADKKAHTKPQSQSQSQTDPSKAAAIKDKNRQAKSGSVSRPTRTDQLDPKPSAKHFQKSPQGERKESKPFQKGQREKKAPEWKPQRTNPGTQYDSPATKGASAVNGKVKAGDLFPKKADSGRIDKEALLAEIIELGGTEDDLALVDGIESDDDDEEVVVEDSGKAKDVKKTDIEAFMKEIGLQGGKTQEVDDSEEEEEEEEEEDEDMGDDESDEEEEDDGENSSEGDEGGDGGDIEMADATLIVMGKSSKLLFPKRPDWHAEPLPVLNPPKNPPVPREITSLNERGKALLQAENEVYSKTELVKSSDRQFLSQIMQSGTLTDKISALTLICQESPLHTTKTLESLLALAQKKSRSQAIQALGAIKDLFAQGVCLPPNRKLKFFAKQPLLGAKGMADIHLLVWAYEDWLKNFYFEVLKCLEQLCADQLVYARTNAVGYVYELLKEKPEQEANLLRVLVNKIGDSDKKLMNAHPAMKSIVIKALESEVVFKPGNHMNAKYYAIITLNQTVLASLDHDVANRLLDIYFGVFTSLLHKENAAPTAAQNATGPNSAGLKKHTKFQDAKKAAKFDKKTNKKARLRAKKQEEQAQFEEESNAKLVSAVLTGVNRAFPFSKVDDEVFDKHMDTLFRITHQGNFNTSIQALMLIFQVSNAKQAVSDRFYRTLYESLLDQRLISSSKQALYLNLLFRALKTDTSVKRVKAFVKRIMQVATLHQPSFICGVLYLLSELEANMPSVRTLITEPEPNAEDEEEVFHDMPDSDEDAPAAAAPKLVTPKAVQAYDGRKRDPLHARADRSCLWELLPFLSHFHPTVALYAQCLLDKKPMPSKPDLGMHTLTHFLDRFVYRNAKTSAASTRGTSIMQPLAGGRTVGMVLSTRDHGSAMQPVNTESFWKKKVEDVVPEEVFFHRYFNLTRPGEKKSQGKRKRTDDDDEDSDAEEGEIWKALVESQPELEGEDVDFDDDDDDLEMSDDSDIGMDSEGELDLDDEDEVWESDDDEDEDAELGGDAAAMFEAQLAKATAKRQKMMEGDSDDDDDDDEEGGIILLDSGEKEVEAKEGDGKEGDGKKKRKMKNLPTFASMEDYADMLSDSE